MRHALAALAVVATAAPAAACTLSRTCDPTPCPRDSLTLDMAGLGRAVALRSGTFETDRGRVRLSSAIYPGESHPVIHFTEGGAETSYRVTSEGWSVGGRQDAAIWQISIGRDGAVDALIYPDGLRRYTDYTNRLTYAGICSEVAGWTR
ncbi:hypothetical protein [Wenxinia marina]|uniref:Uncharacterized protein n=1 Tax=Wenxinia marina DSM 24838 TaxID=1123501 RepID=A0A0D0Q584_9RHOB|nr:hypothetical protein [Wenxinia marina]KIQ67667.1 hypothetical protein Wenmar_03796 [Wenxinia marina DSM 24838]GGL79881.1 hypothetical protein GCM10011392_37990 [Wenxinia marina]